MARRPKILETNLKSEEILSLPHIFYHGEVLKRIFFRNPGIAEVLAVERDVKPRNMKFAKVVRGGRGGAINREGAFIRINTVLYF